MGWRDETRLPPDVLDDIDEERAAIQSLTNDTEEVPSLASGGSAIRSRGPLPQDVNASSADERRAMLLDSSGDIEQPQAPYEVPTLVDRPDQSGEMPIDFRRGLLSFAGGDVAAYDRRKADWENRGFNRENQDLQLQERRLGIQGKQGDLEDAALQRQNARALIDPTSPHSRQAQQLFQRYLSTLAQAPGVMDSALGKELVSAAQNVPNMSAAQISQAREAYDKLFGNTLKAVDTQADAALAAENMDLRRRSTDAQERQAAASMGLSWAEYEERKRHNQAMEGAKNKPAVPPQKTISDFNKRGVALKEIQRIKELMNSGKVRYTGKGANALSSLFSVLPGQADLRNKEERELVSLVKRLRAPERNKIYGAALSAYDIADSNQFMADIEQNPDTLLTNLDTLESALSDEQAATRDTYPALTGNDDQIPESSGDAGSFSGAQPKPRVPQTAKPALKPLKAPAGAPVGKRLKNPQDGRIYVVQPDGTMKLE